MSSTDESKKAGGKSRPRSKRLRTIWQSLETITDPEIPVINIVEMGMINDVRIDDEHVTVDMTPTFAGCPALDFIRNEIRVAVSAFEKDVKVNVVFDPPWSTDRITEPARKKLKAFGLAPPTAGDCGAGQESMENIPCPLCDSTNTSLESIFGPTLCRSIHYCNECLQSFEFFKTVR